jgi:hypothetical protein
MITKEVKRVSRAGLDRFVTKMIKKGDRAPASFYKMKRIAESTATDLKVKGKKFKIPWGLLLIIIPVLIILYLIITRIKRPDEGYTPGKHLDEPVDLKGRETKDLLNDFGYK